MNKNRDEDYLESSIEGKEQKSQEDESAPKSLELTLRVGSTLDDSKSQLISPSKVEGIDNNFEEERSRMGMMPKSKSSGTSKLMKKVMSKVEANLTKSVL